MVGLWYNMISWEGIPAYMVRKMLLGWLTYPSYKKNKMIQTSDSVTVDII